MVAALQHHSGIHYNMSQRDEAATHIVHTVQQGAMRRPHRLGFRSVWGGLGHRSTMVVTLHSHSGVHNSTSSLNTAKP